MYITHNLSEDKLLFAMDIGGFAMPSFAIINPDLHTLTSFGNITLVGNQNYFFPKTGKNNKALTFKHDAYSPRMPNVNYIYDRKILENNYLKIVEDFEKQHNYQLLFKEKGLIEVLTNERSRRESDNALLSYHDFIIMEMYAISNNQTLPLPEINLLEKLKIENQWEIILSETQQFLKKYYPKGIQSQKSLIEENFYNNKGLAKYFIESAFETIKTKLDLDLIWQKYENEQSYKDLFKDLDSKRIDSYKKHIIEDHFKKYIDLAIRYCFEQENIHIAKYDLEKFEENFIKIFDIRNHYENLNKFVKQINNKLNIDSNKKTLFKGYTYSGKKREVPYNLTNCYKAMMEDIKENGDIRGSEHSSINPDFISYNQLKSHKAFNDKLTTKEVLASINNLVSMEELDKFASSFQEDLDSEIRGNFQQFSSINSFTIFTSYVLDRFGEYPYSYNQGKEVPIYHMNKYYEILNPTEKEELNKILNKFYSKFKQHPSHYLEIKLKEKINFQEDKNEISLFERSIKGVILPSDLNRLEEIKSFLEKEHVQVVVQIITGDKEYDEKKTAELIKAISNQDLNLIHEIDQNIKKDLEKVNHIIHKTTM